MRLLEDSKLLGILECLLFAAGDEGLSLKQICSTMDIGEETAMSLINELQTNYNQDHSRGITVTALAETFQLATKREFADYLAKLVESPGSSTLSQAGLETLAIIAYKQPITRMEIEEVRGVKTERPLQTLIAKGLIMEVGRAEGTGRAKLYGTTKEFLDYFGLNHLKELPELPKQTEEDELQEDADLFFSTFKDQIE
ncbi:SMC-Scp complex subunit ScpB [Bacillus sp. IITD106]|nr:SMC-Scp complex subunit ScpB [Bacillus sp. IITD106]